MVTKMKLERIKKGLTQHDLAQLMGTTRKQIYLWERELSIPRDENKSKLDKILKED